MLHTPQSAGYMSAPSPRVVRDPSHAGSWYNDNPGKLSDELGGYLNDVPDVVGSESRKQPRALIAPHAGYSYSGPAAAWAYKTIDPLTVRRIFLLGPSHHVFLKGCALSTCDVFRTPIGDLEIDKEIYEEIKSTKQFTAMTQSVDQDEHSLEMHLPYIVKVFGEGSTEDDSKNSIPPLVPILVGALNNENEKKYGALLAPYLNDPNNLFIISSDFCHWGKRFGYTLWKGEESGIPLHKSIEQLDREGIEHITSKDADGFYNYLQKTKNTICGRHPIGVLLRALKESEGFENMTVELLRYEQSSAAKNREDSSVSYVSAVVY